MIAPCAPVLPPQPQGDTKMAPMRSHTSIGHESDPMAFLRPRGDPKNSLSPDAYFHQVFFRGGGTLPTPGALASVACLTQDCRGRARVDCRAAWHVSLRLGLGRSRRTCITGWACTVVGITSGSSSSSPPVARGHTFYISRWSCHL